MFQIKICGITRPADALTAAKSGADAIGLNFYSKSKRFVDSASASEIVKVIKEDPNFRSTKIVGVFVDQPTDQIKKIADSLQLDAVQLHGNYQPEDSLEFSVPVVFVMGFEGEVNLDPNSESRKRIDRVAAVIKKGAPIQAILLDKKSGDQFGGTGKALPWDGLDIRRIESIVKVPVILAGGLRPENIELAIDQTGPKGVDVAGGVESGPGEKSEQKIQDFVRNSKAAFKKNN